MEDNSAIKINEILTSATVWINLEGTMLNEISQRKTNARWFHLYVESKNKINNKQNRNKLTDTDNILAVARWEGGVGDGWKKKRDLVVQIGSYSEMKSTAEGI